MNNKSEQLIAFILKHMRAPYQRNWTDERVREELKENFDVTFSATKHEGYEAVKIVIDNIDSPDVDQVFTAICHILRHTGYKGITLDDPISRIYSDEFELEETAVTGIFELKDMAEPHQWQTPCFDSFGEWMD